MISSKKLLTDLKKQVTLLEDDLRQRCKDLPDIDAPLRAQYDAAKVGRRTAMTYGAWLDEQLTQVAVAWVLACVFVRFLEDNVLVEVPKLAGPGALGQRARDEHELYFQKHPTLTEREYLENVFAETGTLPAMREFFDRRHNPLWQCGPSGDAAAALLDFWRKADPDTGLLVHDFTDPEWNTRFLGDLYQDLSEAARKKYALLQTPEFIEEFILDRTLGPAIDTFGYQVVRMIDPTCGSGHFLLGGFFRVFRLWQRENPGENPRVLAQNALNAIHGVDLNPYAVAIARFRLLLAALQVCGITKLKNAPDFTIHLASGDSLLHGARFDNEGNPYVEARQELFGGEEKEFKDELKHHYEVEDMEVLHLILGQQYHAVVGNPPYITVKDGALSGLYRERYSSCSGKYSLSVPFMERFFDLAIRGDRTPNQPAGFTGQITSNSFMKREFGKKLIEEYLPLWDLTHVIDTAGAYIPGHGTPTVILFGKNQRPVSRSIRTVLGIRGEPATPDDPSQGVVWQTTLWQIDQPGSVSEWMSAADSERENFHRHPWSIGGGGAAELKEKLDKASVKSLGELADQLRGKPNIGITAFTLEDDAFIQPEHVLRRQRLDTKSIRMMVEGDTLRDWVMGENDCAVWPYDENFQPIAYDESHPALRLLWLTKTNLANNFLFGKQTKVEAGLCWYEFGRLTSHKLRAPLSITWGEVASDNHFVLDHGGKVFKNSAQVIKLKPDATENQHLTLLGILNSSTACFWMKQVCQPKGTVTGDISSEKGRPEANRYSFNASAVAKFPIPDLTSESANRVLKLAQELDAAARNLINLDPWNVLQKWSDSGSEKQSINTVLQTSSLDHSQTRARAVYLQEELDWAVYALYGICDHTKASDFKDLPPELGIAPEIRPFQWPSEVPPDSVDVKILALYAKRRALAMNSDLQLLENDVCKRLWLGRQGVYGSAPSTYRERQVESLGKWLLARLESYFYEGSRVSERKDGFDPAAHGFTAASRPHLVSARQLAEVVQADPLFLEVAECLEGSSGFSVSALVQRLVEAESVPALPRDRYKDSGLRNRQDWEETWRLQRAEDAVEAEIRDQNPETREEELKKLIRKAQLEKVGEIAVPPKYGSGDFKKASYWKLRGKLDVPKERWISYPGAERDGDTSPVIAWAGWDHLQQAQALAEYFLDAKDAHGWPTARLKPLLAALADLLPWLKQWHNTFDPNYGMGLGDYFQGFLEEQCRALEMTVQEVDAVRFEAAEPTARTPARKQAKKRGRKGAEDGGELPLTGVAGHWQDEAFTLLAPKRNKLTDYRMLVWPELLRQMPGDLEFETFRKAYWLLSEPAELEKIGREVFPDVPVSWWRSRNEQVAKDEFLGTLKGAVTLGEVRIWKEGGVRFVRWHGANGSGDFPEAVDDARVALQLATLWTEEEPDAVRESMEGELVLLETT